MSAERKDGGVAFAKRWLEADLREAFPELPRDFISEIAEDLAPDTAKALDHALLAERDRTTGER